jgi:hypothetical protein
VVDGGWRRSDSGALLRAEVAASPNCSLFDLPANLNSDTVARVGHQIIVPRRISSSDGTIIGSGDISRFS